MQSSTHKIYHALVTRDAEVVDEYRTLLEKCLKPPVAGAFGTGFLNQYSENGTKRLSLWYRVN